MCRPQHVPFVAQLIQSIRFVRNCFACWAKAMTVQTVSCGSSLGSIVNHWDVSLEELGDYEFTTLVVEQTSKAAFTSFTNGGATSTCFAVGTRRRPPRLPPDPLSPFSIFLAHLDTAGSNSQCQKRFVWLKISRSTPETSKT